MQLHVLNSFFFFLAFCYAGADETANLRGNALADENTHGNGIVDSRNENKSGRRLYTYNTYDCLKSGCGNIQKLYNDFCDKDCNTPECGWDALACKSGNVDNLFYLTLGTSDVHDHANSEMDARVTLYDKDNDDYSFNIKRYDPLSSAGNYRTYSIYTPPGFSLDKDKIKIEATSDDGWCFDLVKVDGTTMKLEAPCEGGYCEKNALWLDGKMTEHDRNRAYAGNYAKAESWTLYSWKNPRNNDWWWWSS